MDLKTLTDTELDQHRLSVIAEVERRENLAAIPEQVAAMADLYRAGGGDDAALHDAITPA